MGVYIKGIDMPLHQEGCETIIRIQPDGTVLNLQGIHLYATAMQVPPHGRLIDADAADDYAYDELEVSYSYLSPREASRNMQLIYRNMPTIIEAEEEG